MSNRPLCKYCGKPAMTSGTNLDNKTKYKNICASCRIQKRRTGFVYKIYKKNFCEFCNFIAIDSCQLDVDHIDGNRYNNNPQNLQTLCANCHRLKTKLQRKKEVPSILI